VQPQARIRAAPNFAVFRPYLTAAPAVAWKVLNAQQVSALSRNFHHSQ
jgi:hypothetical protein